MKPLASLTAVCMILSLSACQSTPKTIKPKAPELNVSYIEGFGVAHTGAEANQQAWDDAIDRIQALGFGPVDVSIVNRYEERVTYEEDTNGREAYVLLRVVRRTTPGQPTSNQGTMPTLDGRPVGDDLGGMGR